ncbi:solute carrier family 2, facilitated glucose transporter member 1-like [Leptopilina heterotoma]|uniref:solute carrier family 2, facilitated glucose transporter member 1-like n=1 Tax=Leptopilina heterotoma TaxID=63436 RepID=UPI001CAA1644|nr:solute carrier family 2, facilitated glucose transporter member 1-like [Leptopilina heterotoma]
MEADGGCNGRKKMKEMMQAVLGPIIESCLGGLQFSGYQVWTTSSLPYLTSTESPIRITESQTAWMVSIYLLGETIGHILTPLFLNQIGRKYSITLSIIIGLMGLFLILLFDSYICLCVARLLGGTSQAIFTGSIIIYLTEIFDNCKEFIIIILLIDKGGMFLFSLLASFVSYTTLILTILITVVLICLTHCILPESPYFYFLNNKDDKAIKCLKKFKTDIQMKKVESDILKIKAVIMEDEKNRRESFKELFRNIQYRRSLMILVVLELTHQMTGIHSIYGYLEQILNESNCPLNSKYGFMVFSFFQLSAVKNYFHQIDLSTLTWLPLVSLILFGIVYTLGVAPITNLLQGELFPPNINRTAMTFGSILGSIFGFIGTLAYFILRENFGDHSPFLAYATISFLTSLLVFSIIPEIKGKSLEYNKQMENNNANFGEK